MATGSDLIIKILADISDVQKKAVEVENVFTNIQDAVTNASTYGINAEATLSNKLVSLGNTFEAVGSKMTRTFSLPIVAGLGASAKAAIDFEDDFAGVRKTVDASEEEFKVLNQQIRDMSKAIPESANVIANVMEIAGQLGIATEDLTKFTEVMINMGVATNLSAEEAATAFARFANIMHTSSDDYERLGSTVVDLGNNYATTESEITNMALRLAGSAKQLNMSEADVLGLSAALTSVGIRAEAGGTSMSKLMDSMNIATAMGTRQMKDLEKQTGMTMKELHLMSANNSKDFTALADSMGMPVGQMKQIVKAGYDLQKMADIAFMSVDDFAELVKNDAVGALEAFMIGLGDTEKHGADAIELIKELEINERRLTDTMLRTSSASGMLTDSIELANKAWTENVALKEEAEQKYETTKSQLILLKNTFKDLAITIGNAMLPMIKDLSKFLGGLIEKINDMSPERVEAIVKNLLRLAALGPTLKLAGKALGAAGQVGKFAHNIKILSGSFKDLGNNADKILGAKNLSKFLDGGWSKAQLLGQNPRMDDAGNIIFLTENYNKYAKSLEGVALQNHRIDGTLGKLFISSEKIKKSPVFTGSLWSRMQASVGVAKGGVTQLKGAFTSLKGVAGKIAATPFFKGAVFLGLVNHIRKTYQSSEEFREGLSKLGVIGDIIGGIFGFFINTIKELGAILGAVGHTVGEFFDKLTFGQGTTKELVMILGGLLATLTPIGPVIGALTAGVGAFTVVMKMLGAEGVEQNKINKEWASGVEKMGESLSNTETKAMKVAKEAFPALRKELEDSLAIMTNPENLKKGEESLAALEASNKSLLEKQTTFLGEYYDARKESINEYYKTMGEENKANYDIELRQLEEAKKAETANLEVWLERKSELEKKQFEDKKGLNDEELLEYNLLVEKLDGIAEQKLLRDQTRIELEAGMILAKYKKQGEITEQELERLHNLQEQHQENEMTSVKNYHSDRIVELKGQLQRGEIETSEYHRKVAEIETQAFADSEKLQKTSLENQFKEFVGFTVDELNEYNNLYNEIAGIEQLIQEAKDDGRTAEANRLIKKKADIDAEIEEFEKLHKTSRKEMEKSEKRAEDFSKLVPESFTGALEKVKGTWKMSFLSEEVSDEASKAYIAGEDVGDNVAKGAGKGISKNGKGLFGWGRWLIQKIKGGAEDEADIRSPSRVFAGIGGYIAEGVGVGIEKDSHYAVDAVREMTQDMVAETQGLDVGLNATASKNVIAEYQNKGYQQFTDSMTKTIVKELSRNPIRAYVDEDDLEDVVEDTFVREMRRA